MLPRLMRWLLALLAALVGAALILPYIIPLPAQPDQDSLVLAPSNGRFVSVDGVRTFVERAGPAGAPTVLLIHGFGGSTFSWRETLPALAAAGYDAVALDLKGFGLADKRLEEDYSHAAQADFIAQVMTQLDIEQGVMDGRPQHGGQCGGAFCLAPSPAYPGGRLCGWGSVPTSR